MAILDSGCSPTPCLAWAATQYTRNNSIKGTFKDRKLSIVLCDKSCPNLNVFNNEVSAIICMYVVSRPRPWFTRSCSSILSTYSCCMVYILLVATKKINMYLFWRVGNLLGRTTSLCESHLAFPFLKGWLWLWLNLMNWRVEFSE